MTDTHLDIAFWDYDRTRALVDGTVRIDGVDATFHSGRIVTEIFEKMIRDRAYDVSELGMTYFLRTMELDDPRSSRYPCFPSARSDTRRSTSTPPRASLGRRTWPARQSVNWPCTGTTRESCPRASFPMNSG